MVTSNTRPRLRDLLKLDDDELIKQAKETGRELIRYRYENFTLGIITSSEIKRLFYEEEYGWLNNSIINSYLFKAWDNLSLSRKNEIGLYNSFFISEDKDFDSYVFEKRLTILPVHTGDHWLVFIIDATNFNPPNNPHVKIKIFDSIRRRGEGGYSEYLNPLFTKLENNYSQYRTGCAYPIIKSEIVVSCGQQRGGVDCGVFAIMFSICNMNYCEWEKVSQSKIKEYRRTIAVDLLRDQFSSSKLNEITSDVIDLTL